jgi:hypothetical protein
VPEPLSIRCDSGVNTVAFNAIVGTLCACIGVITIVAWILLSQQKKRLSELEGRAYNELTPATV